MDEKTMMPYFVHEGDMTRLEKANARLIHTIAGMIIAWALSLVLTIAAFVWYISLPTDYEYAETITQETEDTGVNIIGGDYNGTTDENP